MSISEKKFPIFSIITVTLNNFEGLKKTCASIEKQSFNDFEWIIIDGGSSDNTLDLLRKKRAETRVNKNPITFISEPDDGIYDAMNKGISRSKGKYLLFLNAGDILATKEILTLLHTYTDKKPDFIYGDSLEPQINEKTIYKPARRYKDINWGMITHHQSMLYRRITLRDQKMHYSLRYKIAADYDFTVRFLQNSNKITYINQPICIFEQGGISQRQAWLGRKEQYIIREELNMTSQAYNLWILTVQSMSYRLRRLSPTLYNLIKSIIFNFLDSNKKKK